MGGKIRSIRFWENQLKSMAWNTENEDGSMVKVIDKPHDAVSKVVSFEDKFVTRITGFPVCKRR
jgi:hypothetical protein